MAKYAGKELVGKRIARGVKRLERLATKRAKWVRRGDRCQHNTSGWTGDVLRVVSCGRMSTYALVKWDQTGAEGRVNINHLMRITSKNQADQ